MSRFVLCFALVLFVSGAVSAQEIEVDQAWIREPPPGTNAAGYMTIHNPGGVSRQLTGVRSDAAERIELHRTIVEDGVARMHPVDAVEIPAGGQVAFEPKGLHLMLIRPVPMKEGDEIELVLELDGDEYVAVQAPVRREQASEHDHGHH
jgi:copper(I)-binding protein